MIVGYFAILRANRTISDAREAPDNKSDQAQGELTESEPIAINLTANLDDEKEKIEANDIAIYDDGSISDGIIRFALALSEMTNRRGIRNEISRYRSIGLGLIEPKGDKAGEVLMNFPTHDSPLHLSRFFSTIY